MAISAIHLLQRFLEALTFSNDKLYVLMIMHMTFVPSALLPTVIDRLSQALIIGGPGRPRSFAS